MLYVVGRKGVDVLPVPQPADRGELDRLLRAAVASPTPGEVGETLIEAFVAGADDDGRRHRGAGRRARASTSCTSCYTQFKSLMTQTPVARFLAPMQVEERERRAEGGRCRRTSSSRRPEALLDALLPKYINTRIYAALLDVGGQRVGGPAAGDEERHGQRGRHDQDATRAR